MACTNSENCIWKVRQRTSAWYLLYVDATRHIVNMTQKRRRCFCVSKCLNKPFIATMSLDSSLSWTQSRVKVAAHALMASSLLDSTGVVLMCWWPDDEEAGSIVGERRNCVAASIRWCSCLFLWLLGEQFCDLCFVAGTQSTGLYLERSTLLCCILFVAVNVFPARGMFLIGLNVLSIVLLWQTVL